MSAAYVQVTGSPLPPHPKIITSLAETLRASDPEARRHQIVDTLADAFASLMAAAPGAFRTKFRKMAGMRMDGSRPLPSSPPLVAVASLSTTSPRRSPRTRARTVPSALSTRPCESRKARRAAVVPGGRRRATLIPPISKGDSPGQHTTARPMLSSRLGATGGGEAARSRFVPRGRMPRRARDRTSGFVSGLAASDGFGQRFCVDVGGLLVRPGPRFRRRRVSRSVWLFLGQSIAQAPGVSLLVGSHSVLVRSHPPLWRIHAGFQRIESQPVLIKILRAVERQGIGLDGIGCPGVLRWGVGTRFLVWRVLGGCHASLIPRGRVLNRNCGAGVHEGAPSRPGVDQPLGEQDRAACD